MKITVVKACSSLGVHVDGSEKGPLNLNEIDCLVDKLETLQMGNVTKELDKDNKRKNFKVLNKYNEELYNKIVNDNNFIITIGGDHSIAISSALASAKKFEGEGILWIDAHSDYHTLESTISGNIHGMPFATITGRNGNELSYFFDGKYINPAKVVLIGGRDIEGPEYVNLKVAGVKIFTTEDVKKMGVKKIMDEAFKIAGPNMHVSYDLDVIDPKVAPGVSVKAKDGINKKEAYEILDELIKNKDSINSFDLVEFNPIYDKNDKTKEIALYILEKVIKEKKF